MKKVVPFLLLAVGAFLIYSYVNSGGSLSKGGASGGKLPNVDIKGQAQSWWSQLYHDPRFYTGLVALIVAVLLSMFWNKIGAFGRGFLLVIGAIAATIFVVKYAA
jgi:hypothetical protein